MLQLFFLPEGPQTKYSLEEVRKHMRGYTPFSFAFKREALLRNTPFALVGERLEALLRGDLLLRL